jgi:hypothetical protein
MTASAKAKRPRTSKRDLFAELNEGMTALEEERQGKHTLRAYVPNFKLRRRVL